MPSTVYNYFKANGTFDHSVVVDSAYTPPLISGLTSVAVTSNVMIELNLKISGQLVAGSDGTVKMIVNGNDLLSYIQANIGTAVSSFTADSQGNLKFNSPLPSIEGGFVPVAGSNVLYTNGGVIMEA